jgi:hypothetical protein
MMPLKYSFSCACVGEVEIRLAGVGAGVVDDELKACR